MIIQWYPGHMTKALRMMEKEIAVVDCIIYVLDARAPFSCMNPKLHSVIGDKPIIYAINKIDMAEEKKVKEWAEYFSKKGNTVVILNSTLSGAAKKIESAIRTACQNKIEKYLAKNVTTTLRAMVVGVPNCGKSTLINNLCGKARTVTGNKAGVTKGKQWVRIASGIEIMDTPGTLWPAFDNDLVAKHLAYIGSIKEEVLDIPELSLDFIAEIIDMDPMILTKRYNFEVKEGMSNLEVLENICKSRGLLMKGGEYDYDKGAYALMTDFKKGKLGCITLEKVSDLKKLTVNHRANRKQTKEEK